MAKRRDGLTETPAIARLVAGLLATAFRRRLIAPDADSCIAGLSEASGIDAPDDAWREAVAFALQAGLIHDPVRLPPGALQCHYHIELTPAGAEAVRAR